MTYPKLAQAEMEMLKRCPGLLKSGDAPLVIPRLGYA